MGLISQLRKISQQSNVSQHAKYTKVSQHTKNTKVSQHAKYTKVSQHTKNTKVSQHAKYTKDTVFYEVSVFLREYNCLRKMIPIATTLGAHARKLILLQPGIT